MEKVENPGAAAIAHGTEGLSDSCANRIAPSAPFQFTIVTSRIPATITKTMTFGQDGDLIKGAAGNLVEGDAKIVCANDHAAFIEILVALQPNQSLIYGVPLKSPVRLVTKDKYDTKVCPDNTLTRTLEHFRWPSGPAVMMIDYDPDPGSATLSKETLVAMIRSAAPALEGAKMIWWTSASSLIRNDETREQLVGIKGQRLYIVVADGADIERAGKALCERLWATGHGRFLISKSGQILERPGIDASVWQPNRLDYAAGASCAPPLSQDRGRPQIIDGNVPVIDTRNAIPDPDQVTAKQARRNKEAARRAISGEAERIKQNWVQGRVDALVGTQGTEEDKKRIEQTMRSAIHSQRLFGDFEIEVVVDGEKQSIAVSDILAQKRFYNGMLTCDPLEPDYMEGKVVGKLYLTNGQPRLYSFAHGGRTYRLTPRRMVVNYAPGETASVVDETLSIIANDDDLYLYGDDLVKVDGSNFRALNPDSLSYELGSRIGYQIVKDNEIKILDPPVKVVRQVISSAHQKSAGLKQLVAVVDVPVLKKDGTVLSKPGYDADEKLLFVPYADPPDIPAAPTLSQISDALDTLWAPFVDFPFVGKDNRAVYLAALLTAVTRPTLPTSPVFGFDAPVQGSGKTLLGLCLAKLSGSTSGVYPFQFKGSDDEMRKRMFSAALKGESTVVLDNIVGTFDSAALAGIVTSDTITDRVLGLSDNRTVPNKMLIILTGNNLKLKGDMIRRSLICRIDPRCEMPHTRRFDVNPVHEVSRKRMNLVAAALTLLRGFHTSGWKPKDNEYGSFADWDARVRQTVLWVGAEVRPEKFGDPIASSVSAQAEDPDHVMLRDIFVSWHRIFGDRAISTKELLSVAAARHNFCDNRDSDEQADARVLLKESLEELCLGGYGAGGDGHALNTRGLARSLGYREDRVIEGYRLEKWRDKHKNVLLWSVRPVERVQR